MTLQRLEPVRVLYLDHVPRMSGAEQSLADLVTGLAQGPVEPIVCLPSDGPLATELRAQGVLVRMVPMSKRMLETSRETLGRSPLVAVSRVLSFLAAGWRLFRLIREVQPAIVHSNTLKTHLVAILPCKLARVPLVWHMRDILPDGWLRKAVVTLARYASVVIVPSRAVAEPFKNRKTFRKCRLIPNGVRVEDFQDAAIDRSLREAMGVAPSDPVVGIVGRIAPWKGQEVFLRAAAMLAARHPRAHFAIVGAVLFPENDVPFERYLHNLVYELGIADRVTFLGWQPAPEAMASIDVFVHASMEPEPFGRAIVEAMAAGKPVIAADGGAVREILPPSAGFVVSPGRPELLADALDRLLEDRKLRKRMGQAGQEVATSFFPVARTVQSVAGLYRSLSSSAKRSAAKRKKKTAAVVKRVAKARDRRSGGAPVASPAPDAPRPLLYQDLVRQGRVPGAEGGRPEPHVPSRRAIPTVRPRQRFVEDVEPQVFEPLEDDVQPDGGELQPYEPDDFGDNFPPVAPRRESSLRATLEAAVALDTRPVRVDEPVHVLEPAVAPPVRAPERKSRRAPAGLPYFAEPEDLTFVAKPVYDLLKRIMDVTVASLVLLIGLPIWAVVALCIKLESRGPVLFKGTVVGRDQKPYTYYKFRSMRIDGDDKAHRKFIERYVRDNGGHEVDGEVVYKLLNDDRVTEVGRFIRKLSIDEIPQLLNVLKGQMSIVGPRPPLTYEYELYDDYAKLRLQVLPGITGMQQVWSRHMTAYEHKLKMDMHYIRQRSIWLDVKLLLRTIPAALRGH